MRVLIDTSAWVDFFNGYPSLERQAVATLLSNRHEICTCGVVVTEVFQGFHKKPGRSRIASLFRDMTFLEPPGIDLYFEAANLYRALRERGKTIRSTVDCVIAVLAEENGCSVLARDQDMDLIFGSGLLSTGLWPVEGLVS